MKSEKENNDLFDKIDSFITISNPLTILTIFICELSSMMTDSDHYNIVPFVIIQKKVLGNSSPLQMFLHMFQSVPLSSWKRSFSLWESCPKSSSRCFRQMGVISHTVKQREKCSLCVREQSFIYCYLFRDGDAPGATRIFETSKYISSLISNQSLAVSTHVWSVDSYLLLSLNRRRNKDSEQD